MLCRLSADVTLCLWILLILINLCQTQVLSELVGLGEFTEAEKKYCEFASGESHTCENCVAKGTECFYCGGTVERCLPYAWYFPGCELNDVKHNKCWVNIPAVVIVVSVIAGILLVIFIFCLCYCYCRCQAYRRARAKAQGEKWNFFQQQNLKRAEMQNRHSLRTEQRERELEAYRIKYGLPTRMSPDGDPIK